MGKEEKLKILQRVKQMNCCLLSATRFLSFDVRNRSKIQIICKCLTANRIEIKRDRCKKKKRGEICTIVLFSMAQSGREDDEQSK